MSADCGKLENFNCFRGTHKGDFPKFGHIFFKCPVLDKGRGQRLKLSYHLYLPKLE